MSERAGNSRPWSATSCAGWPPPGWREAPGQSLQTMASVHAAYRLLVGGNSDRPFDGRGLFFAAAAEAMHRNLIALDEARTALSREEPGAAERVTLRAFAGLTPGRAAKVLKIGRRPADRDRPDFRLLLMDLAFPDWPFAE